MAAFFDYPGPLSDPAMDHYVVTPSDDNDLPRIPTCLIALTSGTIRIMSHRGVEITYTVVAGQPLPFRALRVMATGTTASVAAWHLL